MYITYYKDTKRILYKSDKRPIRWTSNLDMREVEDSSLIEEVEEILQNGFKSTKLYYKGE